MTQLANTVYPEFRNGQMKWLESEILPTTTKAAFSNSFSLVVSPTTSGTSNASFITPHKAVVAASNIQFGFSGYNTGSGSPTGFAWTIDAVSFMRADPLTLLPTGSPIPCTFSGVTSGSVPSGSYLYTDVLAQSIVAGETFYTICYNSSGTAGYNTFVTNQTGSDFKSGNQTVTPTFTYTGANTHIAAIAPAIIIGDVATKDDIAVIVFGDSISANTNGSTITGKLGWEGDILANARPIVNCGIGGSSMQGFTGASFYGAILTPLAPYVRDCLLAYGFNDLFGSARTLAQIYADTTTAVGLIRNAGIRRVVGCTVKAKTTSTDGWSTTVNQTAVIPAAGSGSMSTLNSWIMSNNGLLFDAVFDFGGTLNTTDLDPLNKTGPAYVLLTDTAGTSTSTTSVRTSSSTIGNVSLVGSEIALTHAATTYYSAVVGFRAGSPNILFVLPALTAAASGDTYTITKSFSSDGSHPNGNGYEEASHYFPLAAIS